MLLQHTVCLTPILTPISPIFTAATLLLSQGIHPKVVQERLGHARISITLDIYSHVLPTMQKEASAKIDSLLAGCMEITSQAADKLHKPTFSTLNSLPLEC